VACSSLNHLPRNVRSVTAAAKAARIMIPYWSAWMEAGMLRDVLREMTAELRARGVIVSDAGSTL
jgi:hypothetical protein